MVDVSIVIPIYNGATWIEPCFKSIISQTALPCIRVEVCVCNDASTDNTLTHLLKWKNTFSEIGIQLKIFNNDQNTPGGVGFSKNRAIEISIGEYLCFQDVDDLMMPDRLLKQYTSAVKLPRNTIIGCKFHREPMNSTKRYTKWANSLTQKQLIDQIYTSYGPTIIMPTWFCHREVFHRNGKFSEDGKGIPEDLIFFYKHLNHGGRLHRVDDYLLIYTYHKEATTFSVSESIIWNIRLQQLEDNVLKKWEKFTIWNAGKQGRKFYKSLLQENKEKVVAFCDVDMNKIGKHYIPYDEHKRKSGRPINIIHFRNATPPFVICMKLDLTEGAFETNLQSMNLKEGFEYVLFS